MSFGDLLLILGLAALWGSTALLVRVASVDVSAGFITGARMTIAAAAMLVFSGFRDSLPSLRTRPGQYALMGLLNAALPIGLGAFAATRIPVGVAAILFAPTPLFAALIAAVWLRERLSRVKIGGILLGLFGVVVLIGWVPFEIDGQAALGIAAALASCVCYGFSSNLARVGFPGEGSLRITTGQLIFAALLSAPVALAAWPTQMPSLTTIVILLVFGIVSTGIAYLLFFGLFERIGAVRTQMVALLIPCFGVIWGAIFQAEPVTWNVLAGLAIVLCSLVLVTGFTFKRV